MHRIIKVLFYNSLIFFILLIIAELALGRWLSFGVATWDYPCRDTEVHHTYCPSIVYHRKMEDEDGGHTIVHYINKSSIPVSSKDDMDMITDSSVYNIINLGDSFFQADEISFTETLSYHMEKELGEPVLQVGFSSWSPINMLGWLDKRPLKKGVKVNIFAFINDFSFQSKLSNLRYWDYVDKERYKQTGKIYFNVDTSKNVPRDWYSTAMRASFFYRYYLDFKSYLRGKNKIDPRKKVLAEKISRTRKFSDVLSGISSDCSIMDKYKQMSEEFKTYIEFSLNHSCWRPDTIKAVRNTLDEIERIRKYVEKSQGNVTFFLVPPGWVYEGENLFGKTFWPWHMNADSLITFSGLAGFLESESPVPFIDLEPVIRRLKTNDPEKWYFPHDGHWNAHAHKILSGFLSEIMEKTGNR